MPSKRIGSLSRVRLAHIVKCLADGVAIGGLDGRLFLANASAMTILHTPFGVDRVLDVVRSCQGERSREVVARLHREARGFQGGAPQQDDMTIVVCTADAVQCG